MSLKEKGDQFIKEQQFEHAVACYSNALENDSDSYKILSNRSLAYFKLGNLEEALLDAERCIKVNPKFGRGYMRKSLALNSLKVRQCDAMSAAEEGYRCRQSNSVCKECVTQWLLANQILNKEFTQKAMDSFGLPSGVVILSEAIYKILEEVCFARLSEATMTHKLMTKHLLDIAGEIEEILAKFGHSITPDILNWIHSLRSLVYAANLQRDNFQKELILKVLEKGMKFSNDLAATIDPVLCPVLCPLVVLCVIVVNARAYTLDCMNCGHQERQAICQSLLPLFSSGGILSNDDLYIVSYLCTLIGLLKSFHGRNYILTDDDIKQIKEHVQKMNEILPKLTANLSEHDSLREMCHSTLSVIENDVIPKKGGVIISGGVKFEVDALFSGKDPRAIISAVKLRMKEMKSKSPALYTLDDAEYFLFGSYVLADHNQDEMAVASFELGQFLYIQIFSKWILSGIWSLDEMGSIISGPRNMILEVAAKLSPNNPQLLVNAIIRWKSLYSEFCVLLIEMGLRGTFRQTYLDVCKLQKGGKEIDSKSVSQIVSRHREETDMLAKQVGPAALNIIFTHRYEPIQKVICKDEIVIEYCYLYANDNCIKCGIIVIKPEGDPLSFIVDFSDFNHLVNLWIEELQSLEVPENSKVSHQLRELIFPPEVQLFLDQNKVKKVVLCPDLSMVELPFDMILFSDNKMLYQKFALIMLTSSREALRGMSISLLKDRMGLSDQSSIPKNHITASSSHRCIIFGNPNFNLESPHQSDTGSLVDVVSDMLQSLHFFAPAVEKVELLPDSEEEANNIEHILSNNDSTPLSLEKFTGDKATVMAALNVQSPFVLHFATHAFVSKLGCGSQFFGGNFWANAFSGLLLAGANTYLSGKFVRISEKAGSGQLTGLAVCSMNLSDTRLVYLSACSSSSGLRISSESPVTLAQAFRATGAQSVIATLWNVSDAASIKFSSLFYSFLCKKGVTPSEALVSAKSAMQQDPEFSHWHNWAAYVCLGCDFPLFLDI